MQNKTVCVIGLGYIGLPTAALLAGKGYQVIGVDVNPKTVEIINKGQIHIVEPDLDAFVRSAVSSGKLKAQTEPAHADIFMVCVPTPLLEKQDGIPQPDISYVESAVKSIAPYLKSGNLIILESTSPVGTTAAMTQVLSGLGVDVSKIHIAYCPERVLPGKIMTELVENDRVVGGMTTGASEAISEFYKSFVRGEVIQTNAPTAEMCKLAENSYRDVNIAYANELSLICANANINVTKLIELANRHPRVNILTPGVGVGGHCIAVDPWFVVAKDPHNARLIHTARTVNDGKTEWVIAQIADQINTLKSSLQRKPTVACFGLAFKPDIDDLRESPALLVAEKISAMDCELLVVEPNIEGHASFTLCNPAKAYDSADLLIFLVKHRQFIDLVKHADLSGKTVLDYCGIL
ncbi:UDP-N-acetyl-D-mannosamine dehydrogenase [Polynucleobacter sp. AP-Kaivos-20-H2]|uniref:UDP-N-acetyl-D-mannosamine dehydrogenase n=1 Tax=Polynucleobacter sp. AP-Kaivos-20-H2 TaxID=2689104 RepID=UPI001C0D745C|nr:UDP-N-acetyl-D-mannosamine dehydrogenase [Polynucleobacter sp. AP-Kaivos-20-H2]MBU3604105.1 UDP-N-acetyl-D-mannosamine dehydrogenase [Polynucleobacter sp. AP-Kaivos-20-H2]